MSKRYSGKSFKDSSVMKKPKLTFKEKRKLKEEKKEKLKKVLGMLVLGLLAFANQAKSEVIELKNCFTVQHSEWHATKFYNLKNRYEESTWSIII